MAEIASTFKIAYHKKKIESYLLNKSIFPATLELDISSECNRKCQNCPSARSTGHQNLSIGFVDRLFACLEGQTKGLLLTGGEPTMAPTFPEVLKMARKYGFVDVAVVTNGSFLDKKQVFDALLKHASTIRVSMHDWAGIIDEGLYETLKQIETLRSLIDKEGSKLQIGISALTSKAKSDALMQVTNDVESAGAHWIYFHPLCIKWDTGSPERVDQTGVLKKIEACRKSRLDGFKVFAFQDRYVETDLDFSGYHSAHFLLTVGADRMNYLGAEVKYQPQHIIADLTGKWRDDFLWQRKRLGRIQSVNSRKYPAINSRHRGMLFSHLIERFKKGEEMLSEKSLPIKKDEIMFPHIL
jgi:organic radical activating enzyme